MTVRTKSGEELIQEFFAGIETIDGVQKNVAETLFKLHRDGKLTGTNISNELTRIREENPNED